jgi:hypothetical protein
MKLESKKILDDISDEGGYNSNILPAKACTEVNNSYCSIRESNDCFRGLEGKTTDGVMRKRMLKAIAREEVFNEQDRQGLLGIYDPEAIADAYFNCTELARVSARMLGIRDEKEANVSLGKTTTDLIMDSPKNYATVFRSQAAATAPSPKMWHTFETKARIFQY